MIGSGRHVAWALAGAAALAAAWPGDALAYRPFDGTDAAVADPGEFELEFEPAGLRHDDGGTALVAPATVLNLGIFSNWEAVLEGRGETPLAPHRGRTGLLDNAFSLKGVLRDGVLQDRSGSSIATEFGALLPEIHGETGTGASWAGIISQRWFDAITTHLNGQVALTRDHHADYFGSTIVEGPFEWPVRPVAEIFYDRDMGTAETTVSGLIGAIWQINDRFSADIGLRDARTNDRPVQEIRLGFTSGFPIWHPASR